MCEKRGSVTPESKTTLMIEKQLLTKQAGAQEMQMWKTTAEDSWHKSLHYSFPRMFWP